MLSWQPKCTKLMSSLYCHNPKFSHMNGNGQFRICHVLQVSGTDFYLMCYFIFASTVLHLPVTEFCERHTGDTAQDPSFTNPNIVVLLANFVSSLLFPNLLRIKSNMDWGERPWSRENTRRMVQRSPRSSCLWTRSPHHSCWPWSCLPCLYYIVREKSYKYLELSAIRKLTPGKTDLTGNASLAHKCIQGKGREKRTPQGVQSFPPTERDWPLPVWFSSIIQEESSNITITGFPLRKTYS